MPSTVKQRADLTFKHNLASGRHGWLRLTPAYSVKIVEDILSRSNDIRSVLDPFSGTATTPLCAAMKGYDAVSVDINPFLVWLGRVKTCYYGPETINLAKLYTKDILILVSEQAVAPAPIPPISNIHRWWDDERLLALRVLKAAIDLVTGNDNNARDLLYVAFCRTLIRLSQAAFNHQSVSFRKDMDGTQKLFRPQKDAVENQFSEDASFVLESAQDNPRGEPTVILGDARRIDELVTDKFDLVITSPPYPNRISYIRELRPYMYWLGYLKEAREAGDLDWEAIGGTWGIATSRLAEWRVPEDTYEPSFLTAALNQVASYNAKSGTLLANYIRKYFSDMWRHICSLRRVLNVGAEVHYIIGNSKFYDVVVPTEEILSDMLKTAAFEKINAQVIRKRNSKQELFEYDVSTTL